MYVRASTKFFPSSSSPTFRAVQRQPVATKSLAARRKYVRQVASLISVCLLFALVCVWVRIQVIQLGYEVSKMRKETSDMRELKNILESEVETLKAPARIETAAREVFGMRLPQSNEIHYVGVGSVAEEGKEKTNGSENKTSE